MQLTDAFTQIVVILLIATAIGAVALRMRQPLIVGFIAVGILVGPSGLGLVGEEDQIHFLAQLGLALLLFVVGLKLDLNLIRTLGAVALATGLGQVIFTSVIGYFIALGLGMSQTTALYVAVALTFSSTIIIVKLLSDKRETDALHGRIAIGLLIVQDLAVVLAMVALVGFAGRDGVDFGLQALLIIARGAALLTGLWLVTYLILPRLTNVFARSPELLVLFAISWAVALASLSEILGFSKEIGAFLAGVSLASTPYREMLGARLVSLRDFLLLFFFIELGTRLDLRLLGTQVWAAIPLSLFVLIGNPLIVMAIMGFMGYRKRTSFLTGLTVAQISEFSLILAALGLQLGHIGPEAVGLITLVGLITIGLSTYMILYSHLLYNRLSPYLSVFERKVAHKEQAGDASQSIAEQADTIIFGLGRYGSGVAEQLRQQGRKVLGVDFDPQLVNRWNARGGMASFGDAEDPEFPASLPLSSANWVINTVRDRDISVALMRSLQSHGFKGSIALTANDEEDSRYLTTAGADIVFIPYSDASSQAVDLLNHADEQARRRKMDKIIAETKDHYIVCGYGRMGQQIVKDFQRYGVPYVVIEKNPVQVPRLKEHNVPHVEGKASEDEILLAAGIDRAKGLIAVAATDEENVFVVLSARGLNPNLIIVARSILEENEDKLRRAGADRVMSPYILGGRRMAAAVLKPRVMDFLDLVARGDILDLEIRDLRIASTSPFINKTITECGLQEAIGATALAVKRAGEKAYKRPDANFVIQEGDELVTLGAAQQLDAAERLASGQ